VARLGLLGGTFNPPHMGHLVCAQEAWAQLGLDRVLLVPAGAPPHKAVELEPGVEHRVRMCELAVEGDPRFGVSRVDVDRPGASYTVDTLASVQATHPEDDLLFIVGGDMAYSLPTWREPARILELAQLAVADRGGLERDAVVRQLATLPGGENVVFFEMPRIDLSSSLIRARAVEGTPVRYLVPERVADYIAREGIYRDGAVAEQAA
jgi:nicotinate-nucleotide adenylyltransferase